MINSDSWIVEQAGNAIARFASGLRTAVVIGDEEWSSALSGTFSDVRASLDDLPGPVDFVKLTDRDLPSICQRSEFESAVIVVDGCGQPVDRTSRLLRESGRAIERAVSPSGRQWIIAYPSSIRSRDYKSIHGWLSEDEAEYLSSIAKGSILSIEFGAWCGRSTLCLSNSEHHVSVDAWFRSMLDFSQEGIFDDMMPIAKWRELTMGLPNVTGIVGDLRSPAMESLLTSAYGGRCDVVFIDANHGYPSVIRDIRLARKLVRPGGVICGHDYKPEFPGVIKAVNECFENRRIAAGSVWEST